MAIRSRPAFKCSPLCAEVASLFQKEFCRYGQYRHDPLLASSCGSTLMPAALPESGSAVEVRISGRCLGKMAHTPRNRGFIDPHTEVRYGRGRRLRSLRIGRSGQRDGGVSKTSDAMGRVPYASHEIDAARKVRDRWFRPIGTWKAVPVGRRRHVGAARFEKLQEAAGWDKWKTTTSGQARTFTLLTGNYELCWA